MCLEITVVCSFEMRSCMHLSGIDHVQDHVNRKHMHGYTLIEHSMSTTGATDGVS